MLAETHKGWLRPDVEVVYDASRTRIRYSHWEISLSSESLAANGDLMRVLERKASIESLPIETRHGDLFSLLSAQGCFQQFGRDETCSMRTLRGAFDRVKSAWYARYYSHPLWARLRDGDASANEFVAWIIHNYHVSRAAGTVAARLVTSHASEPFHEHFRRDAIEEYWHCDKYYFAQSERFRVSGEEIKKYIPLPASFAFELHTLQLAERDPLAHLLIAYFQESTIAFYDDCLAFYGQVEKAYGVDGFFKPWVRCQ